MLSYFTILKTHFIVIPSYFTVSSHPKTLFLLKYYFLIFLYYYFPTVTFFPNSNCSTITNHHTTTTTPHHTSTSMAPPSSITTPPPKCFSLSSYTLHNQKTQTYFNRPAAIDERRGTHEPRYCRSTPITTGKKKKKKKLRLTPIKTQTPPR